MKKTSRLMLLLLVVSMLVCSMYVPASAEAVRLASSNTTIIINNYAGRAITEVYIYPSYNSRWGDPRNSSWISDGGSGKVSVKSSEAALNTTWNLRIGFNYPRYVSYVEWEDFDLSYYLGKSIDITSNSEGGYTISETGAPKSGGSNLNYNRKITITNGTTYAISEVYLYPTYNNRWGQTRNNNWLYSYDSMSFNVSDSEAYLDTEWSLRVVFKINGRFYTLTWDELEIDDLLGSTVTFTMSGKNTVNMSIDYNT